MSDKDIIDFETLLKEIQEQKKTIAELRDALKDGIYLIQVYQMGGNVLNMEKILLSKLQEIYNKSGDE